MLTLIRHTECLANSNETLAGVTESLVTPDGVKQIRALEEYMKDRTFDIVLSSPTSRAHETAKVLNSKMFLVADILKEVDCGIWEGMKFKDIDSQYTEEFKRFSRYLDVQVQDGANCIDERLKIKNFIRLYGSTAVNMDVAIVSHGLRIKMILSEIFGKPPLEFGWLENCGIIQLDYSAQKWNITKYNDLSFLPDELHEFNKNDWAKKRVKN